MSNAAATMGLSLAGVFFLVVCTAMATRWTRIRHWWKARLRPMPYDLRRIFDVYLARINAIQDRRQLYPTILQIATELVQAETSSLLVRNGDGERFVVKEHCGSKPISFQVGDVKAFLDWLEKRGRSVTRRELLERPECGAAKAVGLQYCIQFLAETCIPCFLGGRLLAVINVGPIQNAAGFDPALRDLCDFLSGQFALAIHNASLYEDITKHNMALEELGRLKSQLLANISHEFRTPLSNIIGLSDVLLEGIDGTMSLDQRTHCAMIREAGRRLLGTVSTLVDLSKLEANRLALDVRRINLQKLIQEAAEPLQPTPKTRIELAIAEASSHIYGDTEWLRRVFYHLLANAVKYTHEGKIWVDAERAGEMLRIGVHDTGIGIAKEKQEAIFFPFVQADAGPDRSYEGNGLGLVISRKVVELHGGRMWLTSQPGRGSHFFFTLPLKPTTIRSVEVAH